MQRGGGWIPLLLEDFYEYCKKDLLYVPSPKLAISQSEAVSTAVSTAVISCDIRPITSYGFDSLVTFNRIFFPCVKVKGGFKINSSFERLLFGVERHRNFPVKSRLGAFVKCALFWDNPENFCF